MRRVLLVHYHFLPVHNVGVKHLLGLARHLPSFGWDPVVLTHAWTSIRPGDAPWGLGWEPEHDAARSMTIHRVPEAAAPRWRRSTEADPWLVRKALTLAHMVGGRYPDEFTGWIDPAVASAIALSRGERIDLVVPYCPPETNVIVGGRIARRLGVPWMPYFGDLYGFLLAPPEQRDPGSRLSRALHRRWLKAARGAAAVSPHMVQYVERTYGIPASLVMVGYEAAEFAAPRVGRHRHQLVVSHVGSLYPGNQRPEIFFDGLDMFLRSRTDAAARLVVCFVGSKCDDALRRMVEGRPAEAVVRIQPRVPSDEAVALVRESHALLAFNCTAFRDRHGTLSYPSKIFEAFGARRPVLAMPPDGDFVDTLLREARAGETAATAADVAGVLATWFDAWAHTGAVPFAGDESVIASFTHERQAAVLAAAFDRAAP